MWKFVNLLYKHMFSVYVILYAGWKIITERPERSLLKKSVPRGGTVVDVGANVGIYTRFFADLVGPMGRVYAFEPAPLNSLRLRSRLRRFPNVVLEPFAVGSSTAVVKLYISDTLNVDHRAFDSGDGRQSVSVQQVALDEYFPTGTKIDVIKIDVQGYETNVLNGAKRVIAENSHVTIFLELFPTGLSLSGSSQSELLSCIESMGLEYREIRKDGKGSIIEQLILTNAEHYYTNIVAKRTFL